jgi:protein-tyrosine kinase
MLWSYASPLSMSRVFVAMQEAARARGADEAPVEAVWTEMGIRSTGAPPVQTAATEVSTTPPALVPAPDAGADAVAVPPAAGLVVAIPTEVSPPGTTAKIVLDKKARLLPNTPDRLVLERYRMLRTKILQEREKKPFRTLVITSAGPQEGKTVTTLNLALSFASLPSFKILLIDGDMRRGTLGDWLGIDRDRPGLSNLIEGSAPLEEILLKSEELSLHVIPSGNAQVSDLESSQFSRHFRNLAEQFDLVLVDTPPVNLVTDVQMIAESCDAVLLIARAFSTSTKSLEEAVDKLQPYRLIGTVLNGGTTQRSRKYNGYY